MEWYERYLQFVSNPDAPFDWRSWHRDGLLFTRQIYTSLPRCIFLRYAVPSEDKSLCVEDFDVSEEEIESLLTGLGDYVSECEPVINDVVAVGLKGEDVGITVRLKIKSNGDTFTFHISYTSLESLKLFLERLALCDQDTISWESTASDHAMYFYPQTIGPFKHMGQFQIYSVEHSRLLHRRFPLLSDSLLPQIPKAGKSACPHAGSTPAILPGGL